MKAFEMWEKEEGCPEVKICPDVPCRVCVGERNRGWKAALKWIYIEMTGTNFSEARNIINKELSR